MATTVDNVVDSKASTSINNADMETARAKGAVAIGIAKLQPAVRVLITYAEIWAYYTLIPFKMGQLTMDVILLGLEITKLSLISVKENTNLFVQLFQHILAIISPDFILKLMHTFFDILTSLVDKIMKELLNIVQTFTKGLEPILESILKGILGGFSPFGNHGDSARETSEPTNETAALQKPEVNGGTPKKSDKAGKSE